MSQYFIYNRNIENITMFKQIHFTLLSTKLGSFKIWCLLTGLKKLARGGNIGMKKQEMLEDSAGRTSSN